MNLSLKRNFNRTIKRVPKAINAISFICSMLAVVFGAYIFGFYTGDQVSSDIIVIFKSLLYILVFISPLNLVATILNKEISLKKIDYVILAFSILSFLLEIGRNSSLTGSIISPQTENTLLLISVLTLSTIYISQAITRLLTKFVNPMAIFSFTFFIFIIIGTVLLSFPNSIRAEGSLNIIDALFISTSATCVTGLTSVDFVETFTLYGQLVVLMLIQVGGLGVITITSFFALSLIGVIPHSGALMLKDLISDSKTNNITILVLRIITTTLIMEAIGAVFIFISIGHSLGDNVLYNVYFSIFHSISAFCNAGFSISPDGLCTPALIGNNSFYIILSSLVVLGGIGFPIYSNLISNFKIHFRNFFRELQQKRIERHIHKWDLNSKVVIRTTIILLVLSTAYFMLFEWNGMFEGLSVPQKITQAFYNATIPRTAGFSSQDITNLAPLTFMVVIILMFIGGAPQSTAGGIKVTTFYIMAKNALCVVRGMDRVEVEHRELSKITVNRAFAVIALSLAIIFTAYFILLLSEPDIEARKLFFEVISAIGTVGSSMGVTTELSVIGKLVITITMFIGRIGVVTLLASVIKHRNTLTYKYPQGHIIIN